MVETQEAITLSPAEEAERLWNGAIEAFNRPQQNVATICEYLALGLRAAEILVVRQLQPMKGRFPATIGMMLESPDAEIQVYRDAVDVPHSVQFTEALDLLSEEGLDCVGPGLHRGWEDRRFSCRRSRRTALEAVGFSIGEADRERLLLLAACRNRIFRLPPPVRLDPAAIRDAFEALTRLVERLRS